MAGNIESPSSVVPQVLLQLGREPVGIEVEPVPDRSQQDSGQNPLQEGAVLPSKAREFLGSREAAATDLPESGVRAASRRNLLAREYPGRVGEREQGDQHLWRIWRRRAHNLGNVPIQASNFQLNPSIEIGRRNPLAQVGEGGDFHNRLARVRLRTVTERLHRQGNSSRFRARLRLRFRDDSVTTGHLHGMTDSRGTSRRWQFQAVPITTLLAPGPIRRCRRALLKQARKGEQGVLGQAGQKGRIIGLPNNEEMGCGVRRFVQPPQQQALFEDSEPPGNLMAHSGFRFSRFHISE